MTDFRRLLIVDDEQPIRDYLREVAEDIGFDVTEAYDRGTFEELLTRHRPNAIFLDLAMPGSDGVPLDGAQDGGPNTPREAVFATFDGNAGLAFAQRMVRTKSHKLIHNVGYPPELYDLVDDPRETRNLTHRSEARGVLDKLRGQLNRWMDALGDEEPRL